jgi:hypothetical protein
MSKYCADFLGWDFDATATSPQFVYNETTGIFTPDDFFTITKDTTLYAVWDNHGCNCAATPTVTITGADEWTCKDDIVTATVNFTNADSVVLTIGTAAGTLSHTAVYTTGTQITYTPAPADYGTMVTITATTAGLGRFCNPVSDYWNVQISAGPTPPSLITLDPVKAFANEIIDLSSLHVKIPGMTYKYYENATLVNGVWVPSGAPISPVISYNGAKFYYVTATAPDGCEGAATQIEFIHLICEASVDDTENNTYSVIGLAGLCWT